MTRASFAVMCMLGVAGGCLLAPCAAVAAPAAAVADCNAHGNLTRPYTVAELRSALNTMPADVKEYTDCYDVIERALLAEISGSHRASGVMAGHGSGGSFLPTPVIVVLALLVLGAAAFGVVALRRRA